MDGNGRWAQARGLPRIEGHRRGMNSVRACVEECSRLGLAQLTLYCLSSENWKRPRPELEALLRLLEQYLVEERKEILSNNIRFTTIGRREGIPSSVEDAMDTTAGLSAANTGMTLCLAINYGSRAELLDAVRQIATDVQNGQLKPDDISEETVAGALSTAGMPDPDLLIRTAGEMRISNFLLWQISYAEIWVTSRHWPEFGVDDLHEALRDYARRERRYGGLKAPSHA